MYTFSWPISQNKPKQGNQDPDTKQKDLVSTKNKITNKVIK